MTANSPVLMPEKSAVQPTRAERQWIEFDAQWCRTCRVCETMCAIAHEGAARPSLARIYVTFDALRTGTACTVEEPASAKHFVSAVVCLQCADAPCAEVCPAGALSRDARTGAILVDVDSDSETACTGCMRCRKACPWGVPQRHPERKVALMCDLCADREAGPLCVEMCPLSGKALRLAREGEAQAGDGDGTGAGEGQDVQSGRAREGARPAGMEAGRVPEVSR